MEQFLLGAVPFAAAWVIWVSKGVSSANALIPKMEQLINLLLEERLNAQSQAGSRASDSNYRSRRD